MHYATVMDVDGRAVVTEADDVIWVADELWQQVLAGDGPLVEAREGGARLDDDLLSFGTPGEGLGRLSYRYLRHDREQRVHVLERVDADRAPAAASRTAASTPAARAVEPNARRSVPAPGLRGFPG